MPFVDVTSDNLTMMRGSAQCVEPSNLQKQIQLISEERAALKHGHDAASPCCR